MRTIGVGIIGWGFMGKTHAQALRSLPLFYPNAGFEVALRCVCARHLENAEAAARAAGFEHFTDDYRELLAREDIDVVSICTPNDQHEEMALAAIRAGKHVYIDKPLAVTAQSAARIAAAAAESPVLTRMVFNNRYLPATLRAKQLVEEGRIGEVLTFSARYLHSGSIDPEKPIGWKQQLQGGVVLDLGSHALDLLTWLVGMPRRVLCKTFTLYADRPTRDGGREQALSEDHAQMVLELENGAVGSVEASKIATGSNDELTLEVRGTKGALRWSSMDINWLYFYDNTLPEADYGGLRGFTQIECVGRYPAPGGKFLPPKNSVGWERGHLHCYYTFLDAVARGVPAEGDIGDGARLQALMEALRRSAETNAWIDCEEFDGRI
ncbi:MAG: Gfo/Idh/MocA family oxidoreductase [Clostridia bacterium]|nr:Gfo/Idh/MocA family oxidoreductase [Clostridia bacterium]